MLPTGALLVRGAGSMSTTPRMRSSTSWVSALFRRVMTPSSWRRRCVGCLRGAAAGLKGLHVNLALNDFLVAYDLLRSAELCVGMLLKKKVSAIS